MERVAENEGQMDRERDRNREGEVNRVGRQNPPAVGHQDSDAALRTEIVSRIHQLKARHAEIEHRLVELERHLSLTSDEQLERAQLKKEKLWTKDRIVALTQRLAAAA